MGSHRCNSQYYPRVLACICINLRKRIPYVLIELCDLIGAEWPPWGSRWGGDYRFERPVMHSGDRWHYDGATDRFV